METNYWVCEGPHLYTDVKNWFGVVSEEKGGIIAYFQTEEQALSFIELIRDVTP